MSDKWKKASRKFLMWFGRIMQGRYGADNFSRFLSMLALIFLAIGFLSGIKWFFILGVILILYYYFRFFSKNREARKKENIKYLAVEFKLRDKWKKHKQMQAEKDTHRFFRCPGCKQTVRVPKGHGKVEVTCPKCGKTFIRKT